MNPPRDNRSAENESALESAGAQRESVDMSPNFNRDVAAVIADLVRSTACSLMDLGQLPTSTRTQAWRAANDGNELPWELPIIELVVINQCRSAVDAIEQVLMHQIRREGGYWEDIGAGFGITKQAAHQRFYRCLPAPVPSDIEELLLQALHAENAPPKALRKPELPPPATDSRRTTDFEQVRQLRTGGHSGAQIAALTGIHISIVHRYLRIQKRDRRDQSTTPSRPQLPRAAARYDHVRELARAGHTIKEIVELTTLSRSTVRRYLLDHQ